MRSRLQLACCQLLFLSTIASSAQTPPTTTDVTMVEIQSMDESVEPRAINQYAVAEANLATTLDAMPRAHQATEHEVWKHAEDTSFQSFYQATKEANQVHEARMEQDEDSLEDWMTTYQRPTWEANHHHIITGTLDEVSKYSMEGSLDPNQSLEASVQDGTTLYQPPTAEANHHHNIDATFTLEDAFKYAMEDISDANQSVEASVEDGTTMFQHATAGLIAASNFPGSPTLQTKSPRPLSKHQEAIRSRKRRAETNRLIAASNFPGIPTLQTYISFTAETTRLIAASNFPGIPTLQTKSPRPLSKHREAIRSRKRRASETPERRSVRQKQDTDRARRRKLTKEK